MATTTTTAPCIIWNSLWAQLCHAVLVAVISGCLYLKWSSEKPRRTVWDFYTDASKQIFGSLFLHFTNTGLSDVVRRATDTGQDCDWYLVSIILDCTLGSFLMIFILRAAHNMIGDKRFRAEWIQEGDYKYSGIEWNRPRRVKQIVFWVFVPVAIARILVVGLMCLSGGWLTAPIHWMFGGLEPHIRGLVTLVIVPMPFNIFQFFFLDHNIKRPRKKPPIGPPPTPSPAPPPAPEPLLPVVSFHGCDVPLTLNPERQAFEATLREYFETPDVKVFFGLERYKPEDITGFIEKMMNGAGVISEDRVGSYLQSQLNHVSMFASCNTSGNGIITEVDFCKWLLGPDILDGTDPLVPRGFLAQLPFAVPPARTYEVVSNQKLWESHIIQEQQLRLPDSVWRSQSASVGDKLELGLLVRPLPSLRGERRVQRSHGGNIVMGMIAGPNVRGERRPNHGGWMAMWNGVGNRTVDVSVRPVEEGAARDFNAKEREDIHRQAEAFYHAIVGEFNKIEEHAGGGAVNSRAFLTYFQNFMPTP